MKFEQRLNDRKMSNPFETIEAKLESIEKLILAMQPVKQIPAGTKVEQPITQAEAAEFLGKSRVTLISWRKKGLIQAYRINGRVYYKPSELSGALQKLG